MSCKKPVIMAIDGISRELVEKADCGIYVEPDNTEDLANKIEAYSKNRSIVKKQGENGYAYVKKYFDRKILAMEYIEELKNIDKPGGEYEL